MGWKSRAWQFYKLAVEATEEERHQFYRDWLSTSLRRATISQIVDFMVDYEKYPFFKLSDFIPTLYSFFQIDERFEWAFEDLSAKLHKEMYHDLLAMWVDDPHPKLDITAPRYLRYFDDMTTYDIDEGLQRRAKVKLLQYLQKLAQSDNSTDETKLINALTNLQDNSVSFGDQFIESFAKHLGTEIYAQFRHQARWLSDLTDILSKDKLNVHDIATIYYATPLFKFNDVGTFDLSFSQLLERANDQAKEYMRRWVYTYDNRSPIFILDEEYQPMNELYNRVNWPTKFFRPVKLRNILTTREDKPKWEQLFADFQIIPI